MFTGSSVKRYENNFKSEKQCSWGHFLPLPRLDNKSFLKNAQDDLNYRMGVL